MAKKNKDSASAELAAFCQGLLDKLEAFCDEAASSSREMGLVTEFETLMSAVRSNIPVESKAGKSGYSDVLKYMSGRGPQDLADLNSTIQRLAGVVDSRVKKVSEIIKAYLGDLKNLTLYKDKSHSRLSSRSMDVLKYLQQLLTPADQLLEHWPSPPVDITESPSTFLATSDDLVARLAAPADKLVRGLGKLKASDTAFDSSDALSGLADQLTRALSYCSSPASCLKLLDPYRWGFGVDVKAAAGSLQPVVGDDGAPPKKRRGLLGILRGRPKKTPVPLPAKSNSLARQVASVCKVPRIATWSRSYANKPAGGEWTLHSRFVREYIGRLRYLASVVSLLTDLHNSLDSAEQDKTGDFSTKAVSLSNSLAETISSAEAIPQLYQLDLERSVDNAYANVYAFHALLQKYIKACNEAKSFDDAKSAWNNFRDGNPELRDLRHKLRSFLYTGRDHLPIESVVQLCYTRGDELAGFIRSALGLCTCLNASDSKLIKGHVHKIMAALNQAESGHMGLDAAAKAASLEIKPVTRLPDVDDPLDDLLTQGNNQRVALHQYLAGFSQHYASLATFKKHLNSFRRGLDDGNRKNNQPLSILMDQVTAWADDISKRLASSGTGESQQASAAFNATFTRAYQTFNGKNGTNFDQATQVDMTSGKNFYAVLDGFVDQSSFDTKLASLKNAILDSNAHDSPCTAMTTPYREALVNGLDRLKDALNDYVLKPVKLRLI